MSYTSYDSKEFQEKMRGIVKLGVLGLLLVGLMCGVKCSKTRALRKLEKRNEMRGKAFADYVFADVKTYVLENMPSQREINKEASSSYYDPKWQEEKIANLVKDSTKYADAIRRDAPVVVSKLDGTRVFDKNEARETLRKYGNTYTSFDSVMVYIQSQQALRTGPEYRLKPREIDDGEGGTIITGMNEIPTGREIVKGSNTSEAYKMKVNIRHMKGISKDLAYARAVKAQAIRNLNGRKK